MPDKSRDGAMSRGGRKRSEVRSEAMSHERKFERGRAMRYVKIYRSGSKMNEGFQNAGRRCRVHIERKFSKRFGTFSENHDIIIIFSNMNERGKRN